MESVQGENQDAAINFQKNPGEYKKESSTQIQQNRSELTLEEFKNLPHNQKIDIVQKTNSKAILEFLGNNLSLILKGEFQESDDLKMLSILFLVNKNVSGEFLSWVVERLSSQEKLDKNIEEVKEVIFGFILLNPNLKDLNILKKILDLSRDIKIFKSIKDKIKQIKVSDDKDLLLLEDIKRELELKIQIYNG